MDAGKRELVQHRAGQRCEYCHVPQEAYRLSFHVEHIVATVHQPSGKPDDSIGNLGWACPRCNLHKGPNLSTIDPQTGEQVDLYNPRTEAWERHFEMKDFVIVGLSPMGRGTVRLLQMNAELSVAVRKTVM